jgi:hypothetical protein
MKFRKFANESSDIGGWTRGSSGKSIAARVLAIMIVLLILLSLPASITQAVDPPCDPGDNCLYLPLLSKPGSWTPPPSGDDWTASEKKQITDIVNRAARLPDPPKGDDKIVDTETVAPPNDDYKYIYEKHDQSENIEDVLHLGLNDDLVWPGNLVRGDTVHSFVYNPILIPRAPITLSVGLEGAGCLGPSITQEVVDPKLSTVRQGISDLLKKAIIPTCTRIPARVDYEMVQVYSQSHMNLVVGADTSYASLDLEGQFDWDKTNTKSKILGKYQQVFYTIDIDTPASHAALFDPSRTSVAEIAGAMPAGSMPMYVAGVQYGMMAFIFVETEQSGEEMVEALKTSFETGSVSGSVNEQLTLEEALAESKVNILVYGGDTKGIGESLSGLNGFKKLIGVTDDDEDKEFKYDHTVPPGLPLVYKFRHLKDNLLGEITLTSQYTLVKPVQLRERIRVNFEKFKVTVCDDNDETCDFGLMQVWVRGCNRGAPGSPECIQIPMPPEPNLGFKIVDKSVGIRVTENSEVAVNQWGDVSFSSEEPYDFSAATMEFYGKTEEVDGSGGNDYDEGKLKVPASQFFLKDPKTFSIDLPNGNGEADIYGDFTFKLTRETRPNPPPAPDFAPKVSYEAYNLPDYYLYHDATDNLIYLYQYDPSPGFALYATLKDMPGLSDPKDSEKVSFQSMAQPGYYLRHEGFQLRLQKNDDSAQFAKDATFRKRKGLADDSDDSFVSFQADPRYYENYYLCHHDFLFYIAKYQANPDWQEHCTFIEHPGGPGE